MSVYLTTAGLGIKFSRNLINFKRQVINMSTFTNKLGEERSPYLLQHKHNPIEWYPWGQEAFDKAKSLNRLIFLSVGYSTCHWCHVMERESFENDEVAKILNDNFVSIKVDREERPDVDKLYMSFVQAITGSGGWPMSVFLTPSLDPFFGGTYFPPNDNFGRPGFKSILNLLHEKWTSDPTVLAGQGKTVMEALGKGVYNRGNLPDLSAVVREAFNYKVQSFDKKYGGFGTEPKFPKPVDLEFLCDFYCWSTEETERALAHEMLDRTLSAMQHGGIHDHIGKGFHRYSVDAEWHVPHFEKMLYDQTQLLAVYSKFSMLSKDQYGDTVRDIAEYMLECLQHKAGGFYAAEDADSFPSEKATKKKEGAFCVWSIEELEAALADCSPLEVRSAADIVSRYFDVEEEGNVPQFMDPHGELTGRSVLRMKKTHDEFAKEFGVSADELTEKLKEYKAALCSVRATRPPPHLDSKMVTSWQGLVITAFAKASVSLPGQGYLGVAEKCAEFVRRNSVNEQGELVRAVYRAEDGGLDRSSVAVAAFSDDYALLIQGLLDLYTVNGDVELLKWAERLQIIMDTKFWDCSGDTGYFISEEQESGVKVRIQEDQDGAEPCANSVSVGNLVRLAGILDSSEFKERAQKLVEGASERLAKYPHILPKMISPFKRLVEGSRKIVLVGGDSPTMRDMKKLVLGSVIWNADVVYLDGSAADTFLSSKCSFYTALAKQSSPTVYICEGSACGLPITSIEQLKHRMDQFVHTS